MALLEDQLTEEVTLLSTKLVEAVQKQLEMADTMHNLQRELDQLRLATAPLRKLDENYRKLLPKYNRALDDVRVTREAKAVAEKENAKLKAEVEDLTASLFNEANEMVLNALREAYNFKVKNRKLIEELEEKDTIILSLQENLKEVKLMLYKLEDEKKRTSLTRANSLQRMGLVRLVRSVLGEFVLPEQLALDEEFSDDHSALSELLFLPLVRAVRVDLNNYNHEFKGFVYTIIRPDFTYELSNLKTLRFFKKIWNEELETAISLVPQQTLIIKNWTRTKNFWSTVCDGRAKIEPVKGINENFKLSYRGNTPTADLAPVAIKDACLFCGERRDDMLEHARLYYFKLLGESDDDVVTSYPICNYCTYKLRNICDFFAKLRFIRSNLKLAPNAAFDEFAFVNAAANFNFNRNKLGDTLDQLTSNSNSKVLVNLNLKRIHLDPHEEAKLLKMYLVLLYVRNKIFWLKVGVWDIPEELTESNIEGIPLEEFERFAQFPQDWVPADGNEPSSNRLSQLFRRPLELNRSLPAIATEAPADHITPNATGSIPTASEESLTMKKTPQLAGVEEEPDAGFITAKLLGDFKEKKTQRKQPTEAAVEPVAPVTEHRLLDPAADVNADKKTKKLKKKLPEKEEPPLQTKQPAKEETPVQAKQSTTTADKTTRPKSPEIRVQPPQAVDAVVSPKTVVEPKHVSPIKPPTKQPEAKPEAKTEAKPQAKPEVKPEAKPEVKPETKKTPSKPEAKTNATPDAKPAAKQAAKPTPKPVAAPQPEPVQPSKLEHDDNDEFHSLDEDEGPVPPLNAKSTKEAEVATIGLLDIDQFEMMPPKKKTNNQPPQKQLLKAETDASELEQKLLKRREMALRIVLESASPPAATAPKTVKVNLGTKLKVSDLIKKVELTELGPLRRQQRQRNKHVKDESESEASPAPSDQSEDLKRSTTKKFTKKMNDDLDETLEMLKDSI